jgi:hypothetical protein
VENDPNFPDPENPYSPPKSDLRRPVDPLTIGGPGPGVVRFDAIGDAWTLFRQEMGAWMVLTLLFFLVLYGLLFAGLLAIGGVQVGFERAKLDESVAGVIGGILVIAFYVFMFFVMAVLTGGLFRAACKQIRGQQIGAGDLFGATDVTGPLAGGIFLMGLAVVAGTLLCIIPGLLVAGRLMLVTPLIVDGRMRATEAIAQSWNALQGQTWMAAIFSFVVSLISGLGIYLCGVGILFTAPLYYLAIAVVYRDYFMTKPVADPWVEPV